MSRHKPTLPDASGEPMLYTIDEVARRLNVSRSTVYVLMRSGELPSVRIGAARRVKSGDLAKYIAALTSGTAEEARR